MNLAKAYQPSEYEPNVYALWENSHAFAPTGQGDPYAIVMPPPNANGNLHVGHAYMIPIEDILVRYYRMQGKDTVWIPGADHAGFETWVVFERALAKKGLSRFDFNREELYQMTWDFVESNRGNMELQLRALGASCDWSSLVFTLDKKVINTVYSTFKKLWDDNLIYRGERIVNYCPKHRTSFADIEIEFKEEKSHLWHIAYPLADGVGEIVVATTRPETMLGDVAVAVHPDDKKYKNLIGKKLTLPIVGRQIPVVADDGVELGFGTGAVKITPAHDPLDFEIGERHHLKPISVIGKDGKITDNTPKAYRGLKAEKARQQIVNELEKLGVLRKIEDFNHQVPHCYKCDSTIQPLLMKQWFIKVQPLAQRAKKAIESNKINFVPFGKGRELARYYDELRDWNISRQIPWGIPIPAFHNVDDDSDWIFNTAVDKTTLSIDGKIYVRDEDTFDTWFSSGQWPFIATDYLNQGRLSRFYPNAVMETGVDILRAWVARMVMLGLYVTDKVPFKDVFLHGLILDGHGQKMSKSKGNVVNPMEIIDKYGSDALRIGIVMNRSAGQSQAFSEASVIAGRNFCNKLWNIARFIENMADKARVSALAGDKAQPVTISDHWILSRLEGARMALESNIKHYRFAECIDTIYHVIWDDLADWYIEASKINGDPAFMRHVLNIALRLAHPFAPFVTETIWTSLRPDDDLLIKQNYPDKIVFDQAKASQFEQIIQLVRTIRNATSQLPNKKYRLICQNELTAEQNDLIKKLAKLDTIKIGTGQGLRLASNDFAAYLDLNEDELKSYKKHLNDKLTSIEKEISNLEKRLNNKGYTERAPKNLVAETKRVLSDRISHKNQLLSSLENLN